MKGEPTPQDYVLEVVTRVFWVGDQGFKDCNGRELRLLVCGVRFASWALNGEKAPMRDSSAPSWITPTLPRFCCGTRNCFDTDVGV